MPSNASTSWTYFKTCVFVAHREVQPSEEDFNEFSRDMNARPDLTGIVVLANEHPPSPGQRAQIQRWFQDTGARGAIITDSILARGAVTALSWFSIPVRAFSPQNLEDALSFVGIPDESMDEAQRRLRELFASVAEPPDPKPNMSQRPRQR